MSVPAQPSTGRVAIFGGTFDPPHEGHVQVLRDLLARGYDLVVIALTSQNPFKERQPHSIELRKKMLEMVLAYENLPLASSPAERGVFVCSKGYIYTCEFVDFWREQDSREFSWVIGEDLRAEAPTWKNWDSMKLELEILPEFEGRHSTSVRAGHALPHPALRDFIREKKLYKTT